MRFHDELNPVIWDKDNDNQMRPEVLAKLKEIANAFIEYIEIPEDAVLDMVVTGSSASYNYNKFSDLDLHIIVDYDKIHEDCPLVEGYLGALKNTFNKEHDIFIKDVPVELYAEKKDQGTVHNGLYSVQQEEWIDKPEKIAPTDNDAAVEAKFNEIKEMVDKCNDSEEADELLDKIYTMRKAGLAEAGEFCTENLAFKKLRNEGCMDKLRKIKKEQIDKQLSLESYNEAEDLPRGMKTKINKAYKDLKEATKEIVKWCDARGWYGPRLTHKYSTPTTKVCYLWHGKFNSGFCDCIVTIDWGSGDIIYNIKTGPKAEVEKEETLQTKDLQEFIAWFKEVFDYEYQNLWDDKQISSESDKKDTLSDFNKNYDKVKELNDKLIKIFEDKGYTYVSGRFDWLEKKGNYPNITLWWDKVEVSFAADRKMLPLKTEQDLENIIKYVEQFEKQLEAEYKNESIKESKSYNENIDDIVVDNYLKMLLDNGHVVDTPDSQYIVQVFTNKKLQKLVEFDDIRKAAETFIEFTDIYTKDEDVVLFKQMKENGKYIKTIDSTWLNVKNKNESIKESKEDYPKNREELINKYKGVFKKNGITLEISNLYNKKEDNFSGGFGKSYNVEGKVFNKFEKAIEYMKKLNNKNESIKEGFFVGNDKYIIVPVSYAYNDIRILDKKTGEFLKDENGDNLKFSSEEECGNYIKSLDEDLATLEKKVDKAESDIQDIIKAYTTNESIFNRLDNSFKKALKEEVEIDSHKFTFKVTDTNIQLKSDWYETIIDIDGELDQTQLKSDIEDTLDFESTDFFEGEGEITGTELVGFKYNPETKEGEFEFNIFFE